MCDDVLVLSILGLSDQQKVWMDQSHDPINLIFIQQAAIKVWARKQNKSAESSGQEGVVSV